MKPWSKRLSIFLLCVGGWYGLVLLIVPRVIWCGVSAASGSATASLRKHAEAVCAGTREYADLDPIHDYASVFGPNYWNNSRYILKTIESHGAPIAIVAYPERAKRYRHGIFARIFLLANSSYTDSTVILLPNGAIYIDSSWRFDRDNPPPDAILADLSPHNSWSTWNVCEEMAKARKIAELTVPFNP